MFFQDERGDHYRVDAIARIGREQKKAGEFAFRYHRVWLTDGEVVEIGPTTFRELTQKTTMFIPAEPGAHVIEPYSDLSGVWRSPIIGWAIGSDCELRPVTPRGINDDFMPQETTPLVEMPGGRIIGSDVCYDNAQVLLDDRRKDRDHADFDRALGALKRAHRTYTDEENKPEYLADVEDAKTALLNTPAVTREHVLLKLLTLRDFVSRDELDGLMDQAEASLNHV